jgi:hypothetical protein
MHQVGAAGKLVSAYYPNAPYWCSLEVSECLLRLCAKLVSAYLGYAPSWCIGGVVYLPHTPNRIPATRAGGGSNHKQDLCTFLQYVYFFLFFIHF